MDQKNPFDLIDEMASQTDKRAVVKPPCLCDDCWNLLARKVFDGIIDFVIIRECKYSSMVNIEEYPVTECTQFKEIPKYPGG